MTNQQNDINELDDQKLIEWFKSRKPLFTDSTEYEGMSLCFVNPELLEEEAQQQEKKLKDSVEAV